jgi:hypothetical protein
MANMPIWIEQMRLFDRGKFQSIKSTTEKYAEIKSLGLETVLWEEYSPERISSSLMSKVKEFIDNYNPCLFIYDPKKSDLKKGFLFNVQTVDEVVQWIDKERNNIKNYNYLITTQITNPGNGFVGSVYSDGNGKLWCETLHYPGVCNQRELSQPTRSYNGFLNELFIEENETNEIWAVSTNWLNRQDIMDIKNIYIHREGYFEFVKGRQHNQTGIYTIGHERGGIFSFNKDIHMIGCNNLSFRTNGALLREFD